MKVLSYTLLLGLLLGSSIANAINFSIDPASPSIDENITPDDVLKEGPLVDQHGRDLGLQDDFFSGIFDNLNALSYGRDAVTRPPPGQDLEIYFSVDRVAVGLDNTAVFGQAQPGQEEAAGDVFLSTFSDPSNLNTLNTDEQELGLTPGFFGDDLDALEIDSAPKPYYYFSVDDLSASSFDPTDLWVSSGGDTTQYADGETQIGLLSDDDIDALVLYDMNLDNIVTPGVDIALFSLSTFSPSTFTFTGNSYDAGVQGSLSPGDILFTDFTGGFSLWAPAAALGLRDDDELNALDTIPTPATFMLIVVGLMFLVGRRLIVQRSNSIFRWVLPLLFISEFSLAMGGADDNDQHFAGTSPPVAGSGSALVFDQDVVNNQTFSWVSSDSILGEINTNVIGASKWQVIGNNPMRLIFEAVGGGAKFRGNVIFGSYNRAVVDVTKGGRRVRYLLKPSSCTIGVFLDLPRWTHPLSDWAETNTCPRSPKYIFGKNRVISIEVKLDDTTLDNVLVEVKNEANNDVVEVTADRVGDVYRSRVVEGDLSLSEETRTNTVRTFIHVREEEVLTFKVKGQPSCQTNWIVDRGEGAATSPRDDDEPAGFWDWLSGKTRHTGIPTLMKDSARSFMLDVISFPPPTTGWWNVGFEPISDDMRTFILKAGENNPEDFEADVLYVAAHSNSHGRLSSYDERIGTEGGWQTHFDPIYLDNGLNWNEDVDWAILDSCQTLSDILPTGSSVKAYTKWIRELKGSPRRTHGLLGFKGNAPGDTSNIIRHWTNLTSAGGLIVPSWIRATTGESWATLFYSRNALDTVHSMQRDPCIGDGLIYRSSGNSQVQRKKIGLDGKFIPARAAEGLESPSAADIPFVDEIVGGQCRSTINLSSISEGDAPRLLIGRNEVLTPLSGFELNADGIYENILNLGNNGTSSNTLSHNAVKSLVQMQMESGFSNLPSNLQVTKIFEDDVVELNSDGNVLSTRKSSYDVFLDQLFTLSLGTTLPIFNSGGHARLMSDGTIEYLEMAYYSVAEHTAYNSIMPLHDSAELAASRFLADYPEQPCLLTDSFLYYGFATVEGTQLEVRPVQIIEFLEGKVVMTIDAVSGDVLEIDSKF